MITTILKTCRHLFAEFENRGIRYSHWKSNQHLGDGLKGLTDIDLLVDKRQSEDAEQTLIQSKFKKVKSQKWCEFPYMEDWLGFDDETGKLLHVHLHYHLLMGKRFVKELHLPIEEILLKTSIRDPKYGIFIADPNLEMLLLMIRIALKTDSMRFFSGIFRNKSIPLPHNIIAEFQYLKKDLKKDNLQNYAVLLFGTIGAEKIAKIIQEGNLQRLDRLCQIKKLINDNLGKNLRVNSVIAFKIYCYRKLLRALAVLKKKMNLYSQTGKIFSKGGKVIAIVGCDGSGKSTIVRELNRWLSWKNDVSYLYMGSGDGNTGSLTRLRKKKDILVRRIKKDRKSETGLEKKNKNARAFMNYAIQALFYYALAKERYRKVMTGYRLKTSGKVVLTDRYPQNQFEGIYDGPHISLNGDSRFSFRRLKEMESRVYRNITKYPPDLVLKLNVPLAVSRLRKPEENVEVVKRKIEITKIIKYNGAKVIDIDAAQPLDKVLRTVKKSVWEFL